MIKCADCGYHLSANSANRRKRPEMLDCIVYSCGNYTRYGNITCTSHSIEARDLYNAVLADINAFADMVLNDPKAVKTIQQKLNTMGTSEATAHEREKRKLGKRLAELDKLFSTLFEDHALERISERNFTLMSEKYEKEQLEIESRLQEIEAELAAKGVSDKGAADFVSLISQYKGITELTAATVNALIDKITVSERMKNENGEVTQCIKIFYKFVGNIHELYIAVPKRICHLDERACTRCGKMYRPGSAVALYCAECRKAVKKEHDEKQYVKRYGGHRLIPKPCECCDAAFSPKSHNARFCPDCAAEAKKRAAKEWGKAYCQKKVLTSVDS